MEAQPPIETTGAARVPERRGVERLAVRGAWLFVAALLVVCLLLALIVPYHATDALVYGTWSRLIGDSGGWFFEGLVGFPAYSRPVAYAPAGWLWAVVGAHEWIGRLISLAFFGLLLWAMARLARERRLPETAPLIACLLLLACPDVIAQAFAAQSDVPVAALVALAAVGLWRRPATPATAALIAVAACAAVLAKATAGPALAGLVLAHLLGPRAGLRERIAWGVVPLAAGVVLAVVYDLLMARHFGLSLNNFVGGIGSGGSSAGGQVGTAVGDVFRAGSGRVDVTMRAGWLGPYLHMVVLYALAYAVLRVAGVAHRIGAIVAWVAGFAAFWLGPALFGGVSPLDSGAAALVASLAFAALLAAVPWCPPALVPERLWLGRLLVWAIPSLGVWIVFGILEDTRTLSPAWPALFLLMGTVVSLAVAALSARRELLAAAAIVLLVLVAVADLRNLDALGARPDGSVNSLRALRDLTPSTWFDPDAARTAADPQLGGLVEGIRDARPVGGRVLTNDGRMPFYFLRQTDVVPEPTCRDLAGHAVLGVFLTPSDPRQGTALAALGRCPGVRLAPAAGAAGSYAVWRIERA